MRAAESASGQSVSLFGAPVQPAGQQLSADRTHATFVQLHMPGGRATLYALVPLGASCGGGDWQVADGHSHTDPSEMPSKRCFLDLIALRLANWRT